MTPHSSWVERNRVRKQPNLRWNCLHATPFVDTKHLSFSSLCLHFYGWRMNKMVMKKQCMESYWEPEFAPWRNMSDSTTINNPCPCFLHAAFSTIHLFSKQSQGHIVQSCRKHYAVPFYMQPPPSIFVLYAYQHKNSSILYINIITLINVDHII